MESIVNQLAEIEDAAAAIVANAEAEKAKLDLEYTELTKQFDEALAKQTKEQLSVIKDEHSVNIRKLLDEQSKESNQTHEALLLEYETHHEAYARQIFQNVTKV